MTTAHRGVRLQADQGPAEAGPHVRPRRALTAHLRLASVAVWTAVGLATIAAQTFDAAVAITSPAPDDFVSGPTLLQASVRRPDLVVRLTFSVDTREICTVLTEPWECRWDAGGSVSERQVRVAVELSDGRRIFHTIRTRGLAYTEAVDVDAVQVTVTVTDDRDKPVGGLSRDRFRVYEDGRPQTITTFAAEDVPLELIVAVDISGSMAPAITKLRAAVSEFLRGVPERDPVSVLAFNDTVVPIARRATNIAERLRGIERLAPWGATALYDVIVLGTDMLNLQGGRKALVVFSDGEDSGSRVALDDVEQRLEGTDVTLYMIGQGRGLTHEYLQEVMQRLVKPTGGRHFSTDNVDKLQEIFAELLEELSNQYLLSYQPTNTTRNTAWRTIRVDVEGYGNVRARDGYRAVPLP